MNTAQHILILAATCAILLAGCSREQAAPPNQPQAAPPRREANQLAGATLTLPPSGENATKALVDSPRHGEWIDVAMPDSNTAIRTWVSYPQREDKAPVVLVVHEIFGMSDWIRSVADQLAAEGYVAVAPDLLSGKGPTGGGTESFSGDSVRAAVRGLSDDEVAARLNAVRAAALKLPASSGATAVMGFCWGGTTAFMYATRQPELKGAVVFYGTAPTDANALERIHCPVLGLYGGKDARVSSTVPATAAEMAIAGKVYQPFIYEGAGHGFLRQQSGMDGVNLQAARQAWQAALGFLRANFE